MHLCWILLTTLFTFVELNCENLFDYRHEEGKDDMGQARAIGTKGATGGNSTTSDRKSSLAGIKATKYKSMIINLPP